MARDLEMDEQLKGMDKGNIIEQKDFGEFQSKKEKEKSKHAKIASVDTEIDDEDVDAEKINYTCSMNKILKFVSNLKERENGLFIEDNIIQLGFECIFKLSSFKSMPPYFVDWIVNNFEAEECQIRLFSDKVLKVKESDVERVYNLPRGHKIIDFQECTKGSVKRLKEELGITSSIKGDKVPITVFETAMRMLTDEDALLKATLLFFISTLLCPENQLEINLKYARVLEEIDEIPQYNWCQHVLEHVCTGLEMKQSKYANADFHFLLINYLDRMGKRSRLAKGIWTPPTCSGWEVHRIMSEMRTIHKHLGLECGVQAGVVKAMDANDRNSFPRRNPLNSETCPKSKVEEYAHYCQDQIKMYTDDLAKLSKMSMLEEASDDEGWSKKPTKRVREDIRDEGMRSRKKMKKNPKEALKQVVEKIGEEEKRTHHSDKGWTRRARSIKKSMMKRVIAASFEDHSAKERSPSCGTIAHRTKKITNKEIEDQNLETDLKITSSPKFIQRDLTVSQSFGSIACRTKETAEKITQDENFGIEVRSTSSPKLIKTEVTLSSNATDPKGIFYYENDSVKKNLNCLFDEVRDGEDEGFGSPIDNLIGWQNNSHFEIYSQEHKNQEVPMVQEAVKVNGNDNVVYTSSQEMLMFEEYEKKQLEDKIAAETRFIEENIDLFLSQSDDDKLILLFSESQNSPVDDQFTKSSNSADLPIVISSQEDNPIPFRRLVKVSSKHDYDSVDQKAPSPLVFKERRQGMKSRFLSTPFDMNVGSSNLTKDEKKLLTFAWDEDEECSVALYIPKGPSKIFALSRQDIWTLQEKEWVSSMVIDTWAHLLNTNQFLQFRKFKRIVTTVSSAIQTFIDMEKGLLERRTKKEASEAFKLKLSMFGYLTPKFLQFEDIDYMLMPAIISRHFIVYVINFKEQKLQYLSSRNDYVFCGTTKKLGQILIEEAGSCLDRIFEEKGDSCPHNWAEWKWEISKVPQQHDDYSCGIFIMKFLQEWEGTQESLKSFDKTWDKKSTEVIEQEKNAFRREACLEILKNCTNSIKDDIQQSANIFCDEIEEKLKKAQEEKERKGQRKKGTKQSKKGEKEK